MKESTKLVLAYVGSAVAANMLLASPVAGATAEYPKVAAGTEGAAALGGAYGAWKLKGKKRFASAIVGGIGAGLLVDTIQSGALTAPATPKPGSTPQSAPKTAPSSGSTLPGPATPIPVQGTTVLQLPGYTSVSGQVPPGSVVPTPNRPPTAQETAAYLQYLEQQAQQQQVAQAQMAEALQEGSIPTATPDSGGGLFDWAMGQAGAAFRLSKTPQSGGFGGRGYGFKR